MNGITTLMAIVGWLIVSSQPGRNPPAPSQTGQAMPGFHTGVSIQSAQPVVTMDRDQNIDRGQEDLRRGSGQEFLERRNSTPKIGLTWGESGGQANPWSEKTGAADRPQGWTILSLRF